MQTNASKIKTVHTKPRMAFGQMAQKGKTNKPQRGKDSRKG